jgi:hypothetical protein
MDAVRASLSEAARRLLRTDGCTLEVPEEFTEQANALALHISDTLPSLVREPEVLSEDGWTYFCIRSDGELIARIGGPEPAITVCWIPTRRGDCGEPWRIFQQLVHDLIEVGYPGCIGCAGPAATEPWVEAAMRNHPK